MNIRKKIQKAKTAATNAASNDLDEVRMISRSVLPIFIPILVVGVLLFGAGRQDHISGRQDFTMNIRLTDVLLIGASISFTGFLLAYFIHFTSAFTKFNCTFLFYLASKENR